MIGELNQLRQLLKNKKLGSAGIEALQQSKLQAIVHHAYAQVPYYRSLFDSVGLHPEDIHTVEDLRHVPITSKADLRAAGLAKTIARGVNLSACISAVTSGSTGKPFTVYFSHQDMRTYRLNAFRALLSIGLRPRDRLAIIGITRTRHTRLYQRLGLYRSLFVHPRLPVSEQVSLLRRIDPTVLWFYPSALRALLAGIDGRLRDIIRPRMLIFGAEALQDNFRNTIQSELGVEIFNFYGTVEVGRIAAECPAHQGLHVNMDHVVLESVDAGNTAVQGKPGEAVVTALNNFTMPFIRYRLGDICTRLEKTCSCGSCFPLMAPPIGRTGGMILFPDGKSISTHAFFPLLNEFTGLDQFRLIQESLDHLVLQLVWRTGPEEQPQREMQAKLDAFLGGSIRLDIQNVDSIPEEKLKFRAFISRLPNTAKGADLKGELKGPDTI